MAEVGNCAPSGGARYRRILIIERRYPIKSMEISFRPSGWTREKRNITEIGKKEDDDNRRS